MCNSSSVMLMFMHVVWTVFRKPANLQDLAPGINPPFITFNGEVKVDVNMIEEFLEDKLTPPRYTHTKTWTGLLYAHFIHWLTNHTPCQNTLTMFIQLLSVFCNNRYPRLAAKHLEANTAGIDIFAKFSAYIKNPRRDAHGGKSKLKLFVLGTVVLLLSSAFCTCD